MKIVGIIGYKDSGKTTLARALACELTVRGRRVAVVKHTSHHIDLAGKDTATLLEAAGQVAKLAEKSPTPRQLEDATTRSDFVRSCSAGLKLAAKPLSKLPPPMSDFAVFFTDADKIIMGMARGFGAFGRTGWSREDERRESAASGRSIIPR